MKIGLIDPALYSTTMASPNLGDQIISRAVHRELRQVFGESTEILAIPSHQYPTPKTLKMLKDADHVFVGGANLLWFRMIWPAAWKIGPFGVTSYRNLILLGVGWGSYGIKANAYGKWMCKLILSGSHVHSVRDSFTRDIAQNQLGVTKALNTACPTMWCLTKKHIDSIPRGKADECIFSLTDYSKNPHLDGKLVRTLYEAYNGHLLFWPQGDGDLEYCRSLGYSGRVIDRTLPSFLKLLSSGTKFDYVGTRLHAGILCLEHGVRSLIIGIDNRAREIARDTSLPVLERTELHSIRRWLEDGAPTAVNLPNSEIELWKRQFQQQLPSELHRAALHVSRAFSA